MHIYDTPLRDGLFVFTLLFLLPLYFHLKQLFCLCLCAGDKGRSWKWKEMLRFPHINQCMDLAMNIGLCTCVLYNSVQVFHLPCTWFVVSSHIISLFSVSERDYYSLCVKQPIGKKLFQLFCRSRPYLQNYISLLDALVHYDLIFRGFLL